MSKPASVQGGYEPARAQLFMLRMWQEDLSEGRWEWRGKVQHIASGEAHYFRDWPGLMACLQQILGNQDAQIEHPT